MANHLELSVVVPTFNESANVHELLERLQSVLGETGWEVVFVDDDSPDDTAALVRSIARSDPRVRCVQRVGQKIGAEIDRADRIRLGNDERFPSVETGGSHPKGECQKK